MIHLRKALLSGAAAMTAAAAILATSLTPSFAQEVTLKLHQFLPQKANVPRLVIDPWIKRVEEAAGGKLKIQHFPSMQLGGKPPELMDQVIDGIADIAWTVNGFTPGRFPRSEVFELPFMMTNAEAASRAYWTLFEKEMKQTDYKDVHIIGTWVHGPGMLHINKPIKTIADMKGVKYRTPSRTIAQLLTELGASPIGMPVTAIPEALSKGVIDGTALPWEVVPALKVQDLVKNHTEFADGYSFYTITFTLAMNKQVYEGLPDDVKKAIDDNSGLEFSALAGKTQADSDGPARELAVKAGNAIVTLTPEESEEWKAAAQPVYDNWVADLTAKGIDAKTLLEEARASIAEFTK